jgi:hypothetical protein
MFMIICRSFHLIRRKVSNKICRENPNLYFVFNNSYSRKSCRLWDNVEKKCRTRQATDDNIPRWMRFACWITMATNTHLGYVIIFAFSRQIWFRERDSLLHSCIMPILHSNKNRHALRPSSVMSIQKSYKEKYDKSLRTPFFTVTIFFYKIIQLISNNRTSW